MKNGYELAVFDKSSKIKEIIMLSSIEGIISFLTDGFSYDDYAIRIKKYSETLELTSIKNDKSKIIYDTILHISDPYFLVQEEETWKKHASDPFKKSA